MVRANQIPGTRWKSRPNRDQLDDARPPFILIVAGRLHYIPHGTNPAIHRQAAKPRRSKVNQRSKSAANIAALASSAEKRAGDLGSVAGGRHTGRGPVWGDTSQNLSSRGNAKQSDRELGGPGARGKHGSSQIEAARSKWKRCASTASSACCQLFRQRQHGKTGGHVAVACCACAPHPKE
jgi:hypothetical protein